MRFSIRAKLFGAFSALILTMAALGGSGFYVLSTVEHYVTDIYDRPVMAINYARSASLTFSQIENKLFRRTPEDEIDGMVTSMEGDLDVARDRALGDDERVINAEIRSLLTSWGEQRRAGASADVINELAGKIDERFDTLIELINDHAFVERRRVVWSMAYLERMNLAGLGAALVISATLVALLSRRIIRPLRAAAAVADRVSHGDFETEIPAGGGDETGMLLGSMRVMQASIQKMIARETAQRESAQTRLADALASASEGMLLADVEGRLVMVNEPFAGFFPGTVEVMTEDVSFFEVCPAVDPQVAKVLLGVAPRSEVRLPDGRWVRLSRNPTQEGGFFLFASDFTAIKEREEAFREAKLIAEAGSAAKSQFLATMSHELRTPLNAVIGFSEIIADEAYGEIPQREYVEYARHVLHGGQQLLEIINAVLEITKAQSGTLDLKPDEVALAELLEACLRATREQCEQAELGFTASLPEDEIFLDGERGKLRQAVQALLSNAVKFSKPGGQVKLALYRRDPNQAVIEIIDTGIGMREEDIPIALAPFGQVDARLSRQYEGIGMGLPLAKAFAEVHGGSLEIESALGVGTTVRLVLPMVQELVSTSAPAFVAAG